MTVPLRSSLLVISAETLMYLEGTLASGEKMPVFCIKLWSTFRTPWLIQLEEMNLGRISITREFLTIHRVKSWPL